MSNKCERCGAELEDGGPCGLFVHAPACFGPRTHITIDGEKCRIVDPDVLADIYEKDKEIESLKAQLAEANSNHESVVDEWKAAMREVERLQAQLAECRDKALEEAAMICDQTPSCRPFVSKDIRSLKGVKHDPK